MEGRESVVHRPGAELAPSRWMTMDDFCRELGVAASTAYKWSAAGPHSGKFPRFRKLPNGSIRIRREWFDEWLDSLDALA
jgi:predicted DNA-binding transcriptional regulator AlpA